MDAPTKDSRTSLPMPPSGCRWAPGAEPMAICMSCNSTFPPHFAECTQCQVALSVVRKCPACGKIQSAHHVTCIYCADSFLREDGLMPAGPGPIARRSERAEKRLRRIAYGVFLGIVLGAGALVYRKLTSALPTEEIGRTFALAPVSMRAKDARDAPPVKDLKASEEVIITAYSHDIEGNRWFRVRSGEINGYLEAQDVAPPKSTDSEKGFEILRHSLMALDDPNVLPQANQAVELYRASFPNNAHVEELRWLLAERTRDFSESYRSAQMSRDARSIYEELAQGGGDFSERAKEALSLLPSGPASSPGRRPSASRDGGEGSRGPEPSPGSLSGPIDPNAPIRRVTVVSKMPLFVRLTQTAKIASGAVLRAEFARDVQISHEVAVPRGTPAVVTAPQDGGGMKVQDLRLTGATIRGESYILNGYARGMDVPGIGRLASNRSLPPSLPEGTTVEFQLSSDLVVRQR